MKNINFFIVDKNDVTYTNVEEYEDFKYDDIQEILSDDKFINLNASEHFKNLSTDIYIRYNDAIDNEQEPNHVYDNLTVFPVYDISVIYADERNMTCEEVNYIFHSLIKKA